MKWSESVVGQPMLRMPRQPPQAPQPGPSRPGPESLILTALLRAERPRTAGGPDDQTIDAVVQKMLAALPSPGQQPPQPGPQMTVPTPEAGY